MLLLGRPHRSVRPQ